jgi:hypothetical protein
MLISHDNGASFSVDTAGLHLDNNGTASSVGIVYYENDYFLAFDYHGVYRKGGSISGINDNVMKQQLWTPYPNPFSNTLNIEGLNNEATLTLISSDGKRISIENNSNAIDLSNCAAGLYYLQITLDDHIEFHKLVKQ